ncbi:PilZ domain-containing protein [Sphingomicrobium marinum]|uniref:PilZ domain-containing protein n=1 Tax=Sphingomicrobium marinum TaxID=1227950 RepID=UPI00223F4908|nr:PilZ domain-containing protein [Sphingomicrobium marinum]
MDKGPVETTLYSLRDEAPDVSQGEDRRDGKRHMTLFRVGAIVLADQRELCLIKNISAGGMMVRVYCDVAPETPIRIELKCGEPISGSVTWVNGNNCGITFDAPIDVLDILATNEHGPRPRMPRIEIECPVTLYDEGHRIEVRALDISQGGIKVESDASLHCDADIAVALPGMAPLAGVVKWASEDCAGITFNRLVPLATLIGWLQERRDGLRKAS